MYFQRYMPHLPAAGEVVLFDRSWYNRAGVERVMGFATEEEVEYFLKYTPAVERSIIHSGIILIKYWLEVDMNIQTERLKARDKDLRKIWKLSPMDLKSYSHWYDYSRARDAMFAATDTPECPWYVVNANIKRHARLNCISHLLSMVPYEEVSRDPVKFPNRDPKGDYVEPDYPYNFCAPDLLNCRREKMSEVTNNQPKWYTLTSEKVSEDLQVDPAQGLSKAEAAKRLEQYGPNSLDQTEEEPTWRAFLRQYKDYMRIVLLAAAIGSVIIGDYTTGLVLFLLTVGSAYAGLFQERKAADSVAALREMMNIQARVRRDGQTLEVPLEEIVPGDVALFEAGDRVPADGRLLLAATLEIEEAALTGESTPVLKDTDPVPDPEAPLGDRIDMAYMQSNVTRGRGEMIVTGTGMQTEVGHIAGLLQATKEEKSPLQKQIDGLTIVIASLAGVALVLIMVFGLTIWDADFEDSLCPRHRFRHRSHSHGVTCCGDHHFIPGHHRNGQA